MNSPVRVFWWTREHVSVGHSPGEKMLDRGVSPSITEYMQYS